VQGIGAVGYCCDVCVHCSVTRLRPGRKYSDIGKLAQELGWGYKDIVTKHEDERKAKAAEWYTQKKAAKAAFAKAQAEAAN